MKFTTLGILKKQQKRIMHVWFYFGSLGFWFGRYLYYFAGDKKGKQKASRKRQDKRFYGGNECMRSSTNNCMGRLLKARSTAVSFFFSFPN